MCYMKPTVGIRELRQNLSVYLRRVVEGESLQVTDRGRPVALLTPLPKLDSRRGRLIADGKLIPARGRLSDLGPPPPARVSGPISEALEAERDERPR